MNTPTSKPSSVRNKVLVLLTGLASLLALSACGSRGDNQTPGAASAQGAQGKGDWVCEAGKAADDWDCIQTENIEPVLSELEARRVEKARQEAQRRASDLETTREPGKSDELQQSLPSISTLGPNGTLPPGESISTSRQSIPAPNGGSTTPPTPPGYIPTTPQPIIDQDADKRPSPEQESTEPGQPNNSGASATQARAVENRPLTTAPEPGAQAQRRQEPAYARFAYRPAEPVRIIDLPADFYAAQLLAVSTKAQIEDFVVAKDLYNMSAARIEREGQILYVLLLGVYESKDLALQAVAHMPEEVRDLKPWVRPVDGLQDSMTRADRLTATASSR